MVFYCVYLQIVHQPIVLVHHQFFAVVKVIIIFCADADEVNGAQVEAVVHLWAHFTVPKKLHHFILKEQNVF